MSGEGVVVGLDVAKATLEVVVRPTGEAWQVANNEAGIAELVARVRQLPPTLLVCEATGRFERAVVAAVAAAGVPVVAHRAGGPGSTRAPGASTVPPPPREIATRPRRGRR